MPFEVLYQLDFTLGGLGEVAPGAGGTEDFAGTTTGFTVAPDLLAVAGGGGPLMSGLAPPPPGTPGGTFVVPHAVSEVTEETPLALGAVALAPTLTVPDVAGNTAGRCRGGR